MQNELIIKMLLSSWDGYLKQTTELFNSLSEEEMYKEIAPEKNRVIYLLGHMVAVHDDLLPLLGFGERKYEHLREAFLTKPDKAVDNLPKIEELKKGWEDVNNLLDQKFAALSPDQWMERHTRVSEEDFAKQPHRNRLNVLISRITHLAYHYGQLVLIKK